MICTLPPLSSPRFVFRPDSSRNLLASAPECRRSVHSAVHNFSCLGSARKTLENQPRAKSPSKHPMTKNSQNQKTSITAAPLPTANAGLPHAPERNPN